MTKICFPHYALGEYDSLKKAICSIKKMNDGWLGRTLIDIVQYNLCYRAYLREFGFDLLIERLFNEVPELRKEKQSLLYLNDWWREKNKKIAPYDIQCYNINDQVTILGHTFNGLSDIFKHRTVVGRRYTDNFHHMPNSEYEGIHIAEIYDEYPKFDEFDCDDDRTYQNYIFRPAPITEDDMKDAFETFHGFNFCMVHENIPEEMLPILYYSGDGNYMLLATAKSQ
jgi:hypothetical protein